MASTDTASTNPLAVRMDPDDLAWLKGRRKATGVSVNSEIKRAVSQYRNRIEAAARRKAASDVHR